MIRNTLLTIAGLITFNCYSQCPPTFSNITRDSCIQYTSPSGNYVWSSSGIYEDTLFGANSNGCDSIITINLNINPLPFTDGGWNVTMCEGDPFTLSGSGASSYVWNNGVIDGIAFIPPTGSSTYTVTGTDINGCESSDDVTINVIPVPIMSFISDTVSGCEPLIVNFTPNDVLNPLPLGNCTWELGDGTVLTGCGIVTHTYLLGYYSVTLEVTNVGGCTSSVTYPDYIFVDECLSVNELIEDKFDLYPNPTRNEIRLTKVPPNSEIYVVNIHGEKNNYLGSSVESEFIIDTRNIDSGIYIVIVKSKNYLYYRRFTKI